MTRRALLVAVAAFALGSLAGPAMPYATERQSIALIQPSDTNRLRGALAEGWSARQTDRLVGDATIVTLERPRVYGQAAWLASWLEYLSGSGRYRR